jgi:hypothetical protein
VDRGAEEQGVEWGRGETGKVLARFWGVSARSVVFNFFFFYLCGVQLLIQESKFDLRVAQEKRTFCSLGLI